VFVSFCYNSVISSSSKPINYQKDTKETRRET